MLLAYNFDVDDKKSIDDATMLAKKKHEKYLCPIEFMLFLLIEMESVFIVRIRSGGSLKGSQERYPI